MSLVVIGAGGHAKVVIDTARALGREVVAVLDDSPNRFGTVWNGRRIEGPILDTLKRYGDCEVVIAIGDNRTRATLASKIANPFATLVHPFAWSSPEAEIGPGTVVFAGVVVQAAASVGSHGILNTGCSVDHDSKLGDFVHVAPGARLAGGVRMEEGAMVGIGAVVIQGRALGAWCVVGAGAAVVRDVDPGFCVVGVPARPITASPKR